MRLETARGRIFIGTRETVARLLGEAPPAPAIAGYSLSSSDPEAFKARCIGVGLEMKGDWVTLPTALGGRWRVTRTRA